MKWEKTISPEQAMKQVQKIFKKRGIKALEMARKEILGEKVECKEVYEALTYFMTEYWQDLARPTLLSVVCEAVGGNPDVTTPIAVPMILISGAIDIHDDIIDESKTKDGRPTVYGKFGKDIALLVGDALMFKGFTLLCGVSKERVPCEKISVIINVMKNMFFELGDAEAMEFRFRGRTDVSPEEYLRIVRKKAADVEAHTRISALLGDGTSKQIEILGKYGRLLGMLIILRDDWIDMVDFEESRHRIRVECLPLPLLYALQNPKAKLEFGKILERKALKKEDMEIVLKLSLRFGGLQQYEKCVEKLENDAYTTLTKIEYSSELCMLIRAMVPPLKRTEEFLTKPTMLL